jgi:hypothetical protein
MAGYSQAELDDVQAKWGIRFPPDLIKLLRERRRLNDLRDSFDWVTGDHDDIQEMLAWPFEGYWRSVERHAIWWPEWGERPDSPADQKEKLHCIFADAPKLIPLTRGLYLPDEPHEVGNPIFSIMRTDIVYFGANLTNLLAWQRRDQVGLKPPRKEIRFWGQAVRYSEDENSVVRRQIAASAARRRCDRL